ncbi:cytochrome c peroxidase [Serratia fonticola]|uniref:Cytochrome c peroxidase n=1 Tax=Serratia fonticola TaxID=47917 RepID=A0A542D352_SERFO|nr:cytochrome c peroxidase [Serratia fonticola]TQI80462.1 cytochrome c peroxidase [Serratia fonticola]TQI97512.1 cytochrome c peroxidase [Serratia fonticola]TVZ72010.1 cytochrome c peroxidase [Serratia fonticola]
MIKKVILGCAVTAVAGYLGFVGYVYHYDQQRIPAVADSRIDTLLTQYGCDYCHTSSAELPFYANLPIAKQLMDSDVYNGNQHFNLDATRVALQQNTAVPEVDLAKMEAVLQNQEMPPQLYKLAHWSGNISDSDRNELLSWIRQQREQFYSRPDTPAELRGAALQPIPASLATDPQKVALGFRLFHDPRLSKDDSISCAHCHQLGAGGVDGRVSSLGVNDQEGPINAPTVFNAVFNMAQFWDGRAADLQEQAGGPPMNPIEMASESWDEIIAKLDQDATLKADFNRVYANGFTGDNITDAIAEFEKTLITPDSPFDRYLKGDENALTAQQKHGYQLFQQNKCGTCHTGVNLGGQSYEIMGLKADYFAARGNPTEADLGRYNVTKNEADRHRFKTPTLRNIAQTAPYFHDGSVTSLNQAVKDMLTYQVGVTLSESDVNDLVALLESMSGQYQPATPPAG